MEVGWSETSSLVVVDGDELLVLGPPSSSHETIGSVVISDDTTCTGLVVDVVVSVIVVAVSVRIAISAGISLSVVIGVGDSVAVVVVVECMLVVVGTTNDFVSSSLLSS